FNPTGGARATVHATSPGCDSTGASGDCPHPGVRRWSTARTTRSADWRTDVRETRWRSTQNKDEARGSRRLPSAGCSRRLGVGEDVEKAKRTTSPPRSQRKYRIEIWRSDDADQDL